MAFADVGRANRLSNSAAAEFLRYPGRGDRISRQHRAMTFRFPRLPPPTSD
jgi:hypothetical protein